MTRPFNQAHGVWLTQKPVAVNSYEMVRQVIAELQPTSGGAAIKACHAGALDPFATGLVLVLVGQATRLFHHLHALPKHYEATVRWGAETDNLDLTGTVVAEADSSALTPDRLDEALAHFIGWHEQVPPAYSNRRVGGERAWRLAQRGEQVELEASRVYLHSARWVSHDLPHSSRLELVSRGGYYVRSLARDVALAVGTRAHLSALHRSRIGPFEGAGFRSLLEAVSFCPTLELNDAQLGELRSTAMAPSQTVRPPSWQPPHGYTALDAPVAAVHRHRPVALLRDGHVETWLEKPKSR